MTTDRTEAALLQALDGGLISHFACDEHCTKRWYEAEVIGDVLAAADAHDRANGIARIRLDDELLRKIARVENSDFDMFDRPPDWLFNTARAVLDLLRNEAL